jgi:hypothetical protein
MNSLVRLSIYLGLFLSLGFRNYLYLYIPLITMVVSYVLYLLRQVNQNTDTRLNNLSNDISLVQGNKASHSKESFSSRSKNNKQNSHCSSPTEENPFMNPLPFDKRDRGMACPMTNEVKGKMEKYFNRNLFRNAGDIFNKNHGQRQFTTNPSTTYPNNRDAFAKWCYARKPTCKEGNGNQCWANTYNPPYKQHITTPGRGSSQ